jgi:hypothetical protein
MGSQDPAVRREFLERRLVETRQAYELASDIAAVQAMEVALHAEGSIAELQLMVRAIPANMSSLYAEDAYLTAKAELEQFES